jgi:D-arabinose 1-dehydrogenase-like Zn-dependent alcohol dehydrogenase
VTEGGPVALPTRRYELVGCGRPLEMATGVAPVPHGTEVLLRVLAAGVCHTDLHLSDGYFDLGRGERIALTDRGIRLPHTLGHENVGEVVALGPDAKGLSIGDRVLVYPWIGCDGARCEACSAREGHLCANPRFLGVFRPGGFADHLLVPDARYLFALDGLPHERAAPLACSGLTSYSALKKFGTSLTSGPLVVVGAGGLGLMCLALLAHMGAPRAIVIEPNADKRVMALEMGALDAIGTEDEDGARIAALIPEGARAVLDFVGSPESISQGVALLGKGGKLVVVGMFGGAMTLAIPLLVLRALSIEGSYVGSLDEMRDLLALVKRKGIPQLPVATRPLSEINEAFAAMRAGTVVGRVCLQPTPAAEELTA